MITKREPKGDAKTALKLSRIFSNRDNTVYPIESDLQRRYCWPLEHITKLFTDYFIELFERNIEADENGDDCFYGTIGDAIFTRTEEGYGMDGKCNKQEIIDMSQRLTSLMAFVVVALYLHCENNGITDLEERKKLFYSYLKTKNKLRWKVFTTFEDSDIEDTIESFIDNTIVLKYKKKNIKQLNDLMKCFKEGKNAAASNNRKYKPFKAVCHAVYNLFDEYVGLGDETIKARLDMLLDKCYIQVEECAKEDRVKKFIEVNSNRVGVADKEIFKTLLCSKGKSVSKKYQEFEEVLAQGIGSPQRILPSVNGVAASEYIMTFALMVMDGTSDACNVFFTLNGPNGIDYHLNGGLLDTEEDVLTYLNICIDICVFLINSMKLNPDSFDSEWYLFNKCHRSSLSYLSFIYILPTYLISKIEDEEKRMIAFTMLLKSSVLSYIKLSSSRYTNRLNKYMYRFCVEVMNKSFDGFSANDFKSSLEYIYYNEFNEYIANDLIREVKRLECTRGSSRSAIVAILMMFEYLAQKECGRKRDNLLRFALSNDIELDHIFPHSKMDVNNEEFIDSIGNMTLLEKTLNASKNNNELLTSERYGDSSFMTTKLMVTPNRYEALSNEECSHIRDSIMPYTASADIINNFENQIYIRRNAIAVKIKEILS